MEILDSHQIPQQNLRYAGFWIRVVAVLVDSFVLAVVLCIIVVALILAGTLSFAETATSADEAALLGMYLLWLLLIVLYFAIMESSTNQGTLGKMAVGIRVGNYKGQKISFLNAVGRYFAKILSQLIFYIGFIMVGFDDKKQGLHDKLAETYVFYK